MAEIRRLRRSEGLPIKMIARVLKVSRNTVTSPADFNAQLQAWLELVNRRARRVLGCAPIDRIAADRAAMLALPPVAPATGWRAGTRLARDHYIRLDGNDYSVHPSVIGRRIEVIADLVGVRVLCDGRLVADHQRLWAKHQSVSDPAHIAAAKILRREHLDAAARPARPDVQVRCLADYDIALGATTTTIPDKSQRTLLGKRFPPQAHRIPADADLITITAGGNDLGCSSGGSVALSHRSDRRVVSIRRCK